EGPAVRSSLWCTTRSRRDEPPDIDRPDDDIDPADMGGTLSVRTPSGSIRRESVGTRSCQLAMKCQRRPASVVRNNPSDPAHRLFVLTTTVPAAVGSTARPV